MVLIFLPNGFFYTIEHVEILRVIGSHESLFTIEVKCFGDEFTLHKGIKGWIFSTGTHELRG